MRSNAIRALRRIAAAVLLIAAGSCSIGTYAFAQAIEIQSDISGRYLNADTATIGENKQKCSFGIVGADKIKNGRSIPTAPSANVESRRCLDADTATILGNGTKMQLWDCWGDGIKKWQVKYSTARL